MGTNPTADPMGGAGRRSRGGRALFPSAPVSSRGSIRAMGGSDEVTRMSWSAAMLRAATMLVASALLFLFVPNRLLGYLSIHIVPNWRDFLLVVYWAAAFAAGCWLFVLLQRDRAR